MSSKSSPASSFGPDCGSSLNSHSDNDQIMDDYRVALSHKLIDLVGEISAIPEYRSSVKKQYTNLARRLKLLMPMFEEIRDSKDPLPEETIRALSSLLSALVLAKELLRFGSEGSKIYLVLERDQVMVRFQEVTSELEKALGSISFEKLGISVEVKEQAELVLAQFRRAKGQFDAPDVELYDDLLCLYNNSFDPDEELDLFRKCVDKLQLCNVADLTQESLALHEMVASTDGDPEERLEKMSMLLKKIKDFVQIMNPNIDLIEEEKLAPPNACGKILKNQKSLIVPDDFRCPISLELMRDPVIISTGQTYERTSIEKWLEAGHSTCPKTQQALTSSALTPNYVLRSLIAQWCETMGIEPPKRPRSAPTQADLEIQSLLQKLTWITPMISDPQPVRSAFAKRNTDNRLAIAEAGAIPLLVHLLSTPDSRIQEHAVTALLNLSICEDNKGAIISSGAVPGIVEVLKKGSMEARENAAATLFSLSVVDENKVTIGSSGAIPPLVTLLEEGSQRGKKDAATALFNLCIYQGNKGKAVRAGVISTLVKLVTEPQGTMVDEALAILAILVGHPEGKAAIGAAEAVPILVDVISNGSSRNKENAAAVLVHLCSGAQQHLIEAQELGVMAPLLDLSQNGTERGKRKAAQLLERMNRIAETTEAAPGSSRHK